MDLNYISTEVLSAMAEIRDNFQLFAMWFLGLLAVWGIIGKVMNMIK